MIAYCQFILYPIINLFTIGCNWNNGIPSISGRYIAPKLHRDVDKFSSRCSLNSIEDVDKFSSGGKFICSSVLF